MKIAYLDTIAGIAGDMTMAAFVSAGMPLDELSDGLRKLPLQGFELTGSHVKRNSIAAVHIDVTVTREPHYHRHLHDILGIIDSSNLPARVKERSSAIFSAIAGGEARVHDTTIEKVHFHEVGALDSIVDIVGTAICLEKFGVERVYTSPIRLGSGGFVKTQHGTMPTPTPATLEILKHYPVVLTDLPHELTTPTGAGIVKALSSGVLRSEIFKGETVGYGAGSRDFPEIPNILRVVIGEIDLPTEEDEVAVVETNIDDMNPQIYPYLLEKLLASGAHDAYLIPVIMKKGRPGMLLSVMVEQSRLDEIVHLIYLHTTTIGVRIQQIGRKKLPRRQVVVQTSFGHIKAKAVVRDGREYTAPEFEECRRVAEERGISIADVFRILEREMSGR